MSFVLLLIRRQDMNQTALVSDSNNDRDIDDVGWKRSDVCKSTFY